jgi:hypothetical protein
MMNQRTSPEITLTETRAGISRRTMIAAAPTLSIAAASLGLGAGASSARDQEETEISRLYADWKRLFENPDWQSAAPEVCDGMADALYDLEREIAAMPSASIMDVYRKLAIADVHEVFVGADFDLVALANEARMALGDAAPVPQRPRG